MVFPSEISQPSNDVNKPSWAYVGRLNSSHQSRNHPATQNYQIPYLASPVDDENEEPFIWLRMILTVFNAVFLAIGLIMIITALTSLAKPETCLVCYHTFLPFLVVGLLTALVSIVGFLGAVMKSYKLLLVYVTFVVFLLMLQMIVFFWSLFGRNNFKMRLHNYLSLKIVYHPEEMTGLLDEINVKYDCCGVNGPLDYHLAGLQVPLSCCKSSEDFKCPGQEDSLTSAGPTTPMRPSFNTKEESNSAQNSATEASPTSLTNPVSALKRVKRSVTSPESLSPELWSGNATQLPTGNYSTVNVTTVDPLLFFNQSNITGGPEAWDIHHVRMRGCYSVLWESVDGNKRRTVGITAGLAVFLSLQLVLLCLSHRIARGSSVIYDY